MSNQENWSNNGKRVFLCLFSVAAYIIPHFFNWQKTSLWHLLEYLEGFQNFAASTTGWVSCWNHPWNVDFSVHRICHCHLAGFRQCHDMTSLVHNNKLPGQTDKKPSASAVSRWCPSVLWARHSQPIAASEAMIQWTGWRGKIQETRVFTYHPRPQGFPVTSCNSARKISGTAWWF